MLILLNSGARGGSHERVAEKVTELLERHGASAKIEQAKDGADFGRLLERAAQGPEKIVVAGGGDGTVSGVAGAICNTGKALGVLPLGTLNHFAKDLKIPLDLESAVTTLVHGRTIEVDVGMVNGRVFINNSSIGLYPEIVRRRDRERRLSNVGKWRAMAKAFIAALRNYRMIRVRLRTPQGEFFRRTPFVFIGNNEYNLQGFGAGGRPILDGGQFCVWIARGTRPWGLLRLGLRAFFGRLDGARDFEAHAGAEFELMPHRRKVSVSRDGETEIVEAPLLYRLRPRALRVLVPHADKPR
jgi:diacylglycerol kinase family enzyme